MTILFLVVPLLATLPSRALPLIISFTHDPSGSPATGAHTRLSPSDRISYMAVFDISFFAVFVLALVASYAWIANRMYIDRLAHSFNQLRINFGNPSLDAFLPRFATRNAAPSGTDGAHSSPSDASGQPYYAGAARALWLVDAFANLVVDRDSTLAETVPRGRGVSPPVYTARQARKDRSLRAKDVHAGHAAGVERLGVASAIA